MIDWKNARDKLGLSKTKYKFYFGDYTYEDFSKAGIATKLPMSRVGWGRRAIEMRANKTHFDCFENDELKLNEIMQKYHIREAFEKVKEDVLVAGTGFLALAGDRVLPFTACEATGTYDWNDFNLKEGFAIFSDTAKKPSYTRLPELPDYFVEYYKDQTIVHQKDQEDEIIDNITGRPLIGLLTYHSTARRPFGYSVLSKPARDAIVDASRTIRQAMISAYHYNSKVDLILGVDNETAVDKIDSQTGDVLKIGTNANGQIPQVGEFAQHALQPFTDTILMAARNFCSATKLNLVNLGISTDAPQSKESLEIVGDDLKDDIVAWEHELGEQLKYFAFTIWLKEQGLSADKIDNNIREKYNNTIPVWLSVYHADLSKFGDGLNKLAQDIPAILKARSVWREIGLSSSEIDNLINSIDDNQLVVK